MSVNIKYIESEYIESGTTQGFEGDFFQVGIEAGDDCIILKKSDFMQIMMTEPKFTFEKADA